MFIRRKEYKAMRQKYHDALARLSESIVEGATLRQERDQLQVENAFLRDFIDALDQGDRVGIARAKFVFRRYGIPIPEEG